MTPEELAAKYGAEFDAQQNSSDALAQKYGAEYDAQQAAPAQSLEDVLASSPIKPEGIFEAVEAIGAGVAQGALEINKALLKGAIGGPGQKDIKDLKSADDIRANLSRLRYNLPGSKGEVSQAIDSASQSLGELSKGYSDEGYGAAVLGGNILGAVGGSAYANPLFTGMAKGGAKLLSGMAPKALQGTAKTVGAGLGTTGAGGVFMGATTGDMDAALDPMTAGLSFLGGAAAQKLPDLIKNSEKLAKIREYFPSIAERQTKADSNWNNMVNKLFDSIPAITGRGQLNKLNRELKGNVENLIKSHYGVTKFKSYDDLRKRAYDTVDGSINRVRKVRDKAWKKVDLAHPIVDIDSVQNNAKLFDALTQDLEVPKFVKNAVTSLKNSKDISAEAVKKAQTQVGKVINSLRKRDDADLFTGEGGLIDKLTQVRKGFLDDIQQSLPEAQKAAFSSARKVSADLFELQANSPLISKAMENNLAGFDIVEKLVGSTKLTSKEQGAMAKFLSGKSKKATQALEFMDILNKSDTAGKLNIEAIRKTIANNPRFRDSVDPTLLKSLDGLDSIFKGVYRSNKTGWLGPAALGTTALAGTGMLYGGQDTLGTAVLISYPALAYIANKSPLKRALAAYSKNLPKNTKQNIENFIQQSFMRMGIIPDEEGNLILKGEQ